LDNASGQVLGFATNGTAQTAATPWNELLALYYQMVTQNEKCPVFISNAKGQQQYQQMYDLTSLKLVRTRIVVDAVEGVAEVTGQGVGGGDGVGAGLDFDGLVAASGADELPD
jgi:hypothetical protein